jgi:hypothetical protein
MLTRPPPCDRAQRLEIRAAWLVHLRLLIGGASAPRHRKHGRRGVTNVRIHSSWTWVSVGKERRRSSARLRCTGNKEQEIKIIKLGFFDCLILPSSPLAVYNTQQAQASLQVCPCFYTTTFEQLTECCSELPPSDNRDPDNTPPPRQDLRA